MAFGKHMIALLLHNILHWYYKLRKNDDLFIDIQALLSFESTIYFEVLLWTDQLYIMLQLYRALPQVHG